jgi:hypothetical protein
VISARARLDRLVRSIASHSQTRSPTPTQVFVKRVSPEHRHVTPWAIPFCFSGGLLPCFDSLFVFPASRVDSNIHLEVRFPKATPPSTQPSANHRRTQMVSELPCTIDRTQATPKREKEPKTNQDKWKKRLLTRRLPTSSSSTGNPTCPRPPPNTYDSTWPSSRPSCLPSLCFHPRPCSIPSLQG